MIKENLNDQRVHIKLFEWINSETEAKDPLLRAIYVSSDSKNYGDALISKSKFTTLIEAVERGFEGEELVIQDKWRELFRLINEEGQVKLRLDCSVLYHSPKEAFVEYQGDTLIKFINGIKEQINQIDWGNYGKTAYIKTNLPTDDEVPFREVLSARQFQLHFYHKTKGKELKKILIEPDFLTDFFELTNHKKEKTFWSDDNGALIYVFEDFCIELIIHAEGLFEYRLIEGFGDDSFISVFDYLPDYTKKETAHLEIESVMDVNRKNKRIKEIIVEKTGMYPFGGSDELNEAAERHDLPSKIIMTFEDDSIIKFNGSDIEYFYIEV